jgi:hypothetical protein
MADATLTYSSDNTSVEGKLAAKAGGEVVFEAVSPADQAELVQRSQKLRRQSSDDLGAVVLTSNGGSSSFVGCRVSGGIDGWFGSAIAFPEVDWDSDGYWQTDRWVIPAGKAGLYQVTGLVYVGPDAGITSTIIFVEGNDPAPALGGGFDFNGVKGPTGLWVSTIVADIYAHVGDEIFIDGGVHGGAGTYTVAGNSYASLVYRGAPTLLI